MDTSIPKFLLGCLVVGILIQSSCSQGVLIIEAIPLTTGIRVTWGYVPPPGFTFIGFSVQYTYEGPCPDTDIDPIFSSVPQGLQQQHQENLIPFSEYTVTVAAVHSDSLILTDSATVTTLPTNPGPPSNVRATDLTTSAATIEWDPLPCLEEHDEIMEYRVDIGFSGSVSKYTVTSDDGSSLRMTGLTRGNSYFFEVYAVGNSTDSELRGAGSAIHLQTLSAPNTTVTPQTKSATVTWQLPELSQQIMVSVESHNITYVYLGPCEEISESEEVSVVDSAARVAVIVGLRPFSNYSVTVESIYPNDVVSTTRYFTTLPTFPDESASSVTVKSITDTQITIAWEPVLCRYQNSNITGYIVLYGNTSSYEEDQQRSPLITDYVYSFTLSGLQSNTSYSFQIFPVTVNQLPESILPLTGMVSAVTQVSPEPPEQSFVSGIPNTFLIVICSLGAAILFLLVCLLCTLVVCHRKSKRAITKASLNLTNFESMQMEGCEAYASPPLLPPPKLSPTPPHTIPTERDEVTSTSNQYDTIEYNNYGANNSGPYSTLEHNGPVTGTSPRL